MQNRQSSSELHRVRERFLAEHELDRSLREPISISWERSKSLNVRPDELDLPYIREPDLDSPLVVAAGPVLRQLAEGLADEPVAAILTSADGVVLNRFASNNNLLNTLDEVQLAPGFSYLEQFAGTNGIGTTLETRKPTLVTGAEHYVETLGSLMCAGVPIIHPTTGTLAGVLDVTGWCEDGAPLLVALARSATAQIEGRLLAQSSEEQTALLNAYLKTCRRSAQAGVVALGDDVVLLNRRLRLALDPQDQAATVEHVMDLGLDQRSGSRVVELPSGQIARLSLVEEIGQPKNRCRSVVSLVHLAEGISPTTVPDALGRALPGVVGRSPSWRRVCQQVAECAKGGVWVAVSGEPGSGRFAGLKAAAMQHVTTRTRFFTPAELSDDGGLSTLETEIEEDGFSVILRDLDLISDDRQRAVATAIEGREHAGWIAATIGTVNRSTETDAVLLPYLSHTVHVPALRHRIDDLEELVPHMLRQLTRGQDLRLSSAALRQLSKFDWPGNVAQLRAVLQEVVNTQRSGIVEVDKLPPSCRSLNRRTLTPIEAMKRDAIVRSLSDTGGDKQAAAEALGMSRATIYRKIREFGIDV
ncbi:GAF domain-containing protein [Rhodococcus sp. Eu-32]|uniref:sigma-54-dependent Fis family transcriptional regulator n=1 Tax=Rhodococcus sp. Eu-32 TaxID=1017319 RepID=UPI000DF2C569|nr:helix-turn-helix domain-containing protein [Rhodococcus sp. Eu-32]RRQ25340.1 GAF domain-containing protein [Rhodococcus sp. Eu-32]